MIDDGLRHIAFAQYQDTMKSWGDVFPHSLFSSYDPWQNWHLLIKVLLNIVSYENVHIAINFLTLFALMLLIDKYLKLYIKYDFGSFTYIIVFSIIYFTAYRYLMIRPDQLSGLFVFGALLLSNRFLPVFLLTVFYGPFYYLFFIYTGSIGLVYLVQKKYRSFTGVFLGSIVVLIYFLLNNYQGYIDTITYILTDQSLRMGLGVGEGRPVFDLFSNLNYFILLPLFLTFSFLLIYKNYQYFKNNSLALFLIITSILWINQYRYFHLFYPFIVLFIISIIINTNKKVLLYKIRRYITIGKRFFSFSKNKPLFYLVALPYAIAVFSYQFNNKSLNDKIKESDIFNDPIYNNKVILLNSMNLDIYKMLYINKTIKTIPSCSIGWFDRTDPEIKDIYIRMQKPKGIDEKELRTLIKYTNADIYIHYMKNKKQTLDFNKLINYGIIPSKIEKNRLIFNIRKDLPNE
ncbi:MAG: hypothetical protein U9Q04_03190 [Campylobacterota bacterium]|nr:hypothetical protein [Campylobacterota bacterium]